MNRVLWLLAICASLAACNSNKPQTAVYSQVDTVSFDDVVLLAQSDISDQTIMTFLDFRRLDFALDAEALIELREAGVGDAVILYLLEIDDASGNTLATDSAPRGYAARSYPAYYYGSRRIGGAAFPYGWYDHRYSGLGYATIHLDQPHNDSGHDVGHAIDVTQSHGVNLAHARGLNSHRRDRGHEIRHINSSPSHAIQHRNSHAVRHATGHFSGHQGGHGRGH